ncbi:hypothetical protein EPUS_05926 [Endocarpon pusillum Z07020]|uniref:Uncharacterized protein n=1 Tax=Endocarpon pusillum (strain Z07020 / HMAS-L-300199) TaxID=1263415 RepID=U1HWW9_ENDPU|nr:uncharacterized protein EPUS_05926 [Endocarpon pusillum Z07020]ERF73914.1 hypothetical protein EPUS_05926 [Endocarpon pusillum Z07020]
MPAYASLVLTFSFILITQISFTSADWDNQLLEKFFPGYNDGFQRILRENCSEQYADYLVNKDNSIKVDSILRGFGLDRPHSPVVECILNAAPEFVKSKMASAQVLLGLTPTILATLGSSPLETAMLAIVARRPLLALFLAAGSPSVFAFRSFEYTKAIEDLPERHIDRPRFLLRAHKVVAILQYLLAAASIANVGELAYRLGALVIVTITPSKEYIVALWAFLGMIIHVLGVLTLRLRIEMTSKTTENGNAHRHPHTLNLVTSQSELLARQEAIRMTILPESWKFFLASWVTSTFTACHIIFGTLVFSTMLFISVTDSLIVIARLMASVIACRIILNSELTTLPKAIEVENRGRS